MKIPTILGLSMLVTAISLGALLYSYQQKEETTTKTLFSPKDVSVVNLTDIQATIVWQTQEPSEGQISYGETPKLDKLQNDNRDKAAPTPHLIHFITLPNLKPNTKYFFKIKSSEKNLLYPDAPLEFKTPLSLDGQNPILSKPIRGTILNTNLNPADESLIYLKINGGSDLATFSSTSGNFILPLKDLRNQDLSSYFDLSSKITAQLIIKRGDQNSKVEISLPRDSGSLPPLTLGQDINLVDYVSPETTKITFTTPEQSSTPTSKYDLNNDGKTNSLDLAILKEAVNKKSQDLKYDLNSDKLVDQKDIDTLSLTLK